ncbi:MAG: uracil-DNA glycosylase [Deltaproteobacteria bacterium]|jgi:DNA polymerase|nr:uracil-DNA glycosylase [Deltaproteobacteria bacterium]
MADHSQEDLLEQVNKLLQYHETLGIKEYPRSRSLERFLKPELDSVPSDSVITSKGTKEKPLPKKHSFDPKLTGKATLNDVREEIDDCHRCSLHETRTNIVFGQGPATAKLMVVADTPGKEDDETSLPIQGAAGELLDRMLQAINLSRDEVYITTLVKCFPGTDAKPEEKEIRTCLPFLFRQIEIICPKVVCTMGTLSSQILLHSSKSLFQLRGRFYNFNDYCTDPLADKIFLMTSLHPTVLLQNKELKKASWQDLQLIQKKLEGK